MPQCYITKEAICYFKDAPQLNTSECFVRGKYFDPLFCHSASSTCSVLQTLTFTTENNVPASLNRKPPLFLSLAQQKVSPCAWERGTNHGAFLIPHSTQSETQMNSLIPKSHPQRKKVIKNKIRRKCYSLHWIMLIPKVWPFKKWLAWFLL